MLSEEALDLLGQWWKVRPRRYDAGLATSECWLFPGTRAGQPMSPRQLNRLFHQAATAAGIRKPSHCTACATASHPLLDEIVEFETLSGTTNSDGPLPALPPADEDQEPAICGRRRRHNGQRSAPLGSRRALASRRQAVPTAKASLNSRSDVGNRHCRTAALGAVAARSRTSGCGCRDRLLLRLQVVEVGGRAASCWRGAGRACLSAISLVFMPAPSLRDCLLRAASSTTSVRPQPDRPVAAPNTARRHLSVLRTWGSASTVTTLIMPALASPSTGTAGSPAGPTSSSPWMCFHACSGGWSLPSSPRRTLPESSSSSANTPR